MLDWPVRGAKSTAETSVCIFKTGESRDHKDSVMAQVSGPGLGLVPTAASPAELSLLASVQQLQSHTQFTLQDVTQSQTALGHANLPVSRAWQAHGASCYERYDRTTGRSRFPLLYPRETCLTRVYLSQSSGDRCYVLVQPLHSSVPNSFVQAIESHCNGKQKGWSPGKVV